MDEKYAVIKVKILQASPSSIHCHYHTSAGGRPSLPEMGTSSQNLARPVWCTIWGYLKLDSNSIPLWTETRPSSLCCARKRWSQAGKKGFSRRTWIREPSWLSSQTMPMVPLGTYASCHKIPLLSKTGMTGMTSSLSSPFLDMPWKDLAPLDVHKCVWSFLMFHYHLCINTFPDWMCPVTSFALSLSPCWPKLYAISLKLLTLVGFCFGVKMEFESFGAWFPVKC